MRIEIQRLRKSYDSTRALDGIDLVIEPGQIIALVGTNGAGKTTLLRSLAGMIHPDRGEIRYDGELFQRDRLELRRRLLFIGDYPAVFEDWSPLAHIGMVLRLYGIEETDTPDRVLELLKELDLLPLAEAPLATLSRGQRYKAALAALLAVRPGLWLLDEPFASGMDPAGIHLFREQARAAASAGCTIVYSTQILEAAERFSDKICLIHSGQVKAFQDPASLHPAGAESASPLEWLFLKLRDEERQ